MFFPPLFLAASIINKTTNGVNKLGVNKNQKNIPCIAINGPKFKEFFKRKILKKVNAIINNVGKQHIKLFFKLLNISKISIII